MSTAKIKQTLQEMLQEKIQEKEDILTLVARSEAKGETLKFINNHTNRVETLQGYVILDDVYFCPIIKDTTYFCLNPLYIDYDKKRVHLSRGSVGGTIENVNHNMDVTKAIEAYKHRAEESEFMRKVTDYKVF
jgi:hypothetical protein